MAKDPFEQARQAIEGDLDIAVTAQVNRWASRFGFPEVPLIPKTLTQGVAKAAYDLLQQRLAGALAASLDMSVVVERVALAQAAADPYGYVRANREIITQTLARYGDSLGLPPAVAGITVKVWTKRDWYVGLTLAALGGAAAFLGARAVRARLPRQPA